MFDQSLLPMRSGGRLFLGGFVCAMVVVDSVAYAILPRSKLPRFTVCVEALGVFLTWTDAIACYPRGDTKIKRNAFY